MKKHLLLLTALLLSVLPSCGPASTDHGCAATIQALLALRQGIGQVPVHLQTEEAVEDGTEFDPNRYFEVFDRLSMEPGYTLDYVYTYDGMGGYPTLFARKVDAQPFLSWDDVPTGMDNYRDHILVEDSAEGYLQYVILASKAEQFYLYWHAGYNDDSILCSAEEVREIVKQLQTGDFGYRLPLVETVKAMAMTGIEPAITLEADAVTVEVVTFTMWGGFHLTTYTIQRTFPHTILDVQNEVLVEYDCGIMF